MPYLYGFPGGQRRARIQMSAYGMTRRRLRRSLGDDVAIDTQDSPEDAWIPEPQPPNLPQIPNNSGTLPAPPSVITQAYKDLLTQAKPSQNPLDYVSPQTAIAAGLDPGKVSAAWATALARFPTQQAAIAAGVPAGVVTSMWAQSRAAAVAPAAASFLDQSPLGIANKYLIGAGAAIVALAGMRGKR